MIPVAATEMWAPKGSFSRRAGELLSRIGGLTELLAVGLSALYHNYFPLALTAFGLAAGVPAAMVRIRGVERGDRSREIGGAIGQWLVYMASALAGATMIFGPVPVAAYLTYFSWVAQMSGTTLSTVNPSSWRLSGSSPSPADASAPLGMAEHNRDASG